MEYELYHHGIKGMKWGVRRFQNKDGTRTPAGKKRARDMSDEELRKEVTRKRLEKSYNDLSKESKPAGKLDKTKKVVDASASLVNTAKQIERETRPAAKKMDLSKMTDQQLREQINRANLERQYQDMFGKPEQVSKGRAYAKATLETAGSVLAVGSSALAIALAIKELKG